MSVISQVIFCGKGSNQTLTHIINQSSLINAYHSVHINIEKNFAVPHNTSWHTPTDMANTLRELQAKIRSYNCHCSVPGLKVNAKVMNVISEGMWNYTQIDDDELDLNERSLELQIIEEDDLDTM